MGMTFTVIVIALVIKLYFIIKIFDNSDMYVYSYIFRNMLLINVTMNNSLPVQFKSEMLPLEEIVS